MTSGIPRNGGDSTCLNVVRAFLEFRSPGRVDFIVRLQDSPTVDGPAVLVRERGEQALQKEGVLRRTCWKASTQSGRARRGVIRPKPSAVLDGSRGEGRERQRTARHCHQTSTGEKNDVLPTRAKLALNDNNKVSLPARRVHPWGRPDSLPGRRTRGVRVPVPCREGKIAT